MRLLNCGLLLAACSLSLLATGCDQNTGELEASLAAQTKRTNQLQSEVSELSRIVLGLANRPEGGSEKGEVALRPDVDVAAIKADLMAQLRADLAAEKRVPSTDAPSSTELGAAASGGGAVDPATRASLDAYMDQVFADRYAAQKAADEVAQRDRQRAQMRTGTLEALDRRLTDISQRIPFSDIEKEKVKQIFGSHIDRVADLGGWGGGFGGGFGGGGNETNSTMTREERTAARDQARKTTEAELKVSLTPEQFEAVNALIDNPRSLFGGGGNRAVEPRATPEAPAAPAEGGNRNRANRERTRPARGENQ